MLNFIFCAVCVFFSRQARGLTLDFDPVNSKSIPVPPSFLGLSHEPLTMAKHVLPTAQYTGFIRLLSSFNTGPFIIRWGGNAQDQLLEPLDDDQWKAMRDLHVSVGVRYMIGLNLKVCVVTSRMMGKSFRSIK